MNEKEYLPKKLLRKALSHMEPKVFLPSAFIIIMFVIIGTTLPEKTFKIFTFIQDKITNYGGAYYTLLCVTLLLVCLFLASSSWAKQKIGGPDAEPDFKRLGWYSMLFSAGMGAGLLFWGVAEPLSHQDNPPAQDFWLAMSAREQSLLYSFFHWGLHPWAVYTVFGLGIAYFYYNKKLALAPRSLLYSVVGGKNIDGFLGNTFDTVCTVGTLFGVSTSLGLGAMQLNAGIGALFDVEFSSTTQAIIIVFVTSIATISVVSGLGRGIRLLSLINLSLMLIFFCSILLLLGNVQFFYDFFNNLTNYLLVLPQLSIPGGNSLEWRQQWTLFYWGWWISWSPFVGIFIARISRGRTIRDFILSSLLIPCLATFLWLTLFGNASIELSQSLSDFPMQQIIETPAKALHLFVDELPYATVLGILVTIMTLLFFITSSDSGSLVDDMVTSGGNPHPPVAQRVFWAVSEGLVALTLLLFGGLKGLQMAAITVALPMSVLLVITAFSLLHQQNKSVAGD